MLICGLLLVSCGADENSNTGDRTATSTTAIQPSAAATTEPEALPAVCDVMDAATVGQIVGGRPMTAAPDATGYGCLFTATDEPNIDLTTAYPPYISQVSLTFNAPQPGLTAGQIADLYVSSRPGSAADISGPPGGQAYSGGGGSAVVLDRDVMIICSTSGTLRPESIPDVQAMCIEIASVLRAQLP